MHTRILLPLDGSGVAETAVPFAVAQAERFRSQLILIRVVEPFPLAHGFAILENGEVWRWLFVGPGLQGVVEGLGIIVGFAVGGGLLGLIGFWTIRRLRRNEV